MLRKFKLMPREEKFSRLLEQLSSEAQNCAGHLKTFIESTSQEECDRAAHEMLECRANAKKLAADVTEALCLTYVTPFDREDIQGISTGLYRITKLIEKVCERLALHEIEAHEGDFSRQVNLIMQEAAVMQNMVRSLTSKAGPEQILKDSSILNDLENEGDIILSELLGALFRDVTDARELILRKDVYDLLEKVIDAYRDVARIALQIVLKYS